MSMIDDSALAPSAWAVSIALSRKLADGGSTSRSYVTVSTCAPSAAAGAAVSERRAQQQRERGQQCQRQPTTPARRGVQRAPDTRGPPVALTRASPAVPDYHLDESISATRAYVPSSSAALSRCVCGCFRGRAASSTAPSLASTPTDKTYSHSSIRDWRARVAAHHA